MDREHMRRVNRNRQMANQIASRGMGAANAAPAWGNGAVSTPNSGSVPPQSTGVMNPNSNVQQAYPQGRTDLRAGGNRRVPGQMPAGQPGNGARGLAQKFEHGIQAGFQPGNIGDINKAIWPFYFQFNTQDIAPGKSFVAQFSVTQEAGFLMRQVVQSTFRLVGSAYEYIDPSYFDEGVNSPNGLTFTMEDAQSTRNFNGPIPEDVSLLGNANFPRIWPSTSFLLPNQTMLMNLSNNVTSTDTFRCFITVMGYRIRIPDAQKILSTVKG